MGCWRRRMIGWTGRWCSSRHSFSKIPIFMPAGSRNCSCICTAVRHAGRGARWHCFRTGRRRGRRKRLTSGYWPIPGSNGCIWRRRCGRQRRAGACGYWGWYWLRRRRWWPRPGRCWLSRRRKAV
jgi:hypothetical protein